MPNMTLVIPREMYRGMKRHSELRWSNVARLAFRRKLEELRWVDKVLSKSKMTEEDAELIGHEIKHEIRKRLWK